MASDGASIDLDKAVGIVAVLVTAAGSFNTQGAGIGPIQLLITIPFVCAAWFLAAKHGSLFSSLKRRVFVVVSGTIVLLAFANVAFTSYYLIERREGDVVYRVWTGLWWKPDAPQHKVFINPEASPALRVFQTREKILAAENDFDKPYAYWSPASIGASQFVSGVLFAALWSCAAYILLFTGYCVDRLRQSNTANHP